jgi:hypothetical protein
MGYKEDLADLKDRLKELRDLSSDMKDMSADIKLRRLVEIEKIKNQIKNYGKTPNPRK